MRTNAARVARASAQLLAARTLRCRARMKRYHMVLDRRTGQTKTELIPDGVDHRAFLEQAMHDCPECQALRARGEPPAKIVDVVPAKRDIIRGRRPRWRTLKRTAGR